MFCAGRVAEDDLKRTMQACGGSIQSTVTNLSDDALGTCDLFEEIQIGGERFVFCFLELCFIENSFLITTTQTVHVSVLH